MTEQKLLEESDGVSNLSDTEKHWIKRSEQKKF